MSSLNATFEVLPLDDLVVLLATNHSTGVLKVTGDQACDLWLVDGCFTFAARTDETPLGDMLVRSGALSSDSLVAAFHAADVGSALAERPDVDVERVRAAVQDRIVEALCPLLLVPDAGYDFFDGEAHPLGAAFGLPVEEALSAARQRLEDWKAIAASIPSLAAVVHLNPSLQPGRTEVTIPVAEWAVLAMVDGRRSVADLVRDSGRSASEVCIAVHRLLTADLVRIAAVA
jgi:hypothetical protein